jgi:hypothetical protein
MLISAPTEQDVSTHLSDKLRTLPTLIEVYVLLVDQVMRKHGFDPERCEFLADQALPRSTEDSTQIFEACWPELSQIDFTSVSLKAGWSRGPEPTMISYESDLLVAAF